MKDLSNILLEYQEDTNAIQEFCETTYQNEIGGYFSRVRNLYLRLNSNIHPITDDELEQILTLVPLDLFSASEALNSIRLRREVVKLKNREKESELRQKASEEVSSFQDLTKTERQEYINRYVSFEMLSYDVLLSAYDAVIQRVETELSFSKELIMGSKKIWDSRRSAESSNPIGQVDSKEQLPEYTYVAKPKQRVY